jgi:hypothetical protein
MLQVPHLRLRYRSRAVKLKRIPLDLCSASQGRQELAVSTNCRAGDLPRRGSAASGIGRVGDPCTMRICLDQHGHCAHLCCNLAERLDSGHDPWHRDTGWGTEAPSRLVSRDNDACREFSTPLRLKRSQPNARSLEFGFPIPPVSFPPGRAKRAFTAAAATPCCGKYLET